MTCRTATRTAISLLLLSFASAASAIDHHFDREVLAPLGRPVKAGAPIRIENVPLA